MFVAGLDAHTRYVIVVVVNKMGERVLAPTRVKSRDTAKLLAVLAPFRPLTTVVETCPSWPWLHDVLAPAGITFVLAHARRLTAIAEANYKRDEIDAELLARMQLAGCIPPVHPTSRQQREWATLLRHRTSLVRQRTSYVNRIHAQLHACGLERARGKLLTREGRRWLQTDARPVLSAEQWRVVRTHLHLIAGLRPLVRSLDRRIATIAEQLRVARLLQTVPGIGPQRALTICAEALPIRRFRTAGQLVSYAGLAPRTKQSGVRGVQYLSIPRSANRWLRGALVRAIVSHVQVTPDSWLAQYYVAQKARLGWPKARIAAARKLTRALHAMLRTNTTWTPNRGELERTHAADVTTALPSD